MRRVRKGSGRRLKRWVYFYISGGRDGNAETQGKLHVGNVGGDDMLMAAFIIAVWVWSHSCSPSSSTLSFNSKRRSSPISWVGRAGTSPVVTFQTEAAFLQSCNHYQPHHIPYTSMHPPNHRPLAATCRSSRLARQEIVHLLVSRPLKLLFCPPSLDRPHTVSNRQAGRLKGG